MTTFFFLAFAAGLAALAWIALGFAGASWLALAITALIAAAYLAGAFELRQFRLGTARLRALLEQTTEPPGSLADWLERVPSALRQPVRLRLEGERAALPGPALAPYLAGLLVMLGMLGTFIGMVLTFRGAVFALEGSTDLQAIRAALAAPIQGLGLAFGTSVAGVAASAMLGLMTAISRRERIEVARLLESRIAGALRPFSAAQQRQATFEALQMQARVLPEVAGKLEAMLERIEQRSQQLDAQLLDRQLQLQGEVARTCAELVEGAGASLKQALAATPQAACEAIQPVVQATMAEIGRDARELHARLGAVAQQQVDALARQSEAGARAAAQTWAAAEAQQRERMDQLAATWRGELASLRQEEGRRGDAAVARLDALQAAVAQHLASLGAALEAPLTRLLETAAEVPQAAAGVISQLRQETAQLAQRENLALQERSQLLERMGSLLDALQHACAAQRGATEGLAASAAEVLQEAGARFARTVDAQAGQAADLTARLAAGAVEVSSLAEAFGESVQLFQAGNDRLVQGLERIEASLRRATERSDEQLAYYVAQAREVIDLSIASQQGLVENLRQLQARRAPQPALAEGEGA